MGSYENGMHHSKTNPPPQKTLNQDVSFKSNKKKMREKRKERETGEREKGREKGEGGEK